MDPLLVALLVTFVLVVGLIVASALSPPVEPRDPPPERRPAAPAPVDCVVSAWRPWTGCSADCDGGTQSRGRDVLIRSSGGGRACPALTESRACNQDPCATETTTTTTTTTVYDDGYGYGYDDGYYGDEYEYGYGNSCGEGYRPLLPTECNRRDIPLYLLPASVDDWRTTAREYSASFPKGCYTIQDGSRTQGLYYNSHPVGRAQDSAIFPVDPICRSIY